MNVTSSSFRSRVMHAACVGHLLLLSAQAQPAWMKARVLQGHTYHATAYDVARARVVLFGGAGTSRLADTWEWDGSNWTQLPPGINPGTVVMAHDVARQRLVHFDGSTWLHGLLTPTTAQTIGTACSGSAIPPVLAGNGSYLGNPAFALELIGARAVSACVFGWSAGTQNLPIPPCTLYLQNPIVPLLALTNQAGWAESPSFPIPLDITLRGASFHAQTFVPDPQGPVLGLTFSAGLRLVIGD